VAIFFARGFFCLGGWRVDAGCSWKRVGDGVGGEEKICRNLRRGEGPGCFGVVRACPFFLMQIDFIRVGCGEFGRVAYRGRYVVLENRSGFQGGEKSCLDSRAYLSG
jgi:hypothetical protein